MFAAILLVQTAGAQSLPVTIDRQIVSATSSLSGEQQKALRAFVEGWADQLATSDKPGGLNDARRTLVEPLKDPSATLVFRRAYADIALSKLTPLVQGKDTQRAIHAMQVIRFLRTSEAVAALAERLSSEREADPGKRLNAASVLAESLSDAKLEQPHYDQTVRAIAAAADTETEPLVLLGEFRALGQIAKRKEPAASADIAREKQVAVLKGLVEKVSEKSDADPRMTAVHSLVLGFRNQWVNASAEQQTKLGKLLAPVLVDVLSAAAKHWDAGHQAPKLRSEYAATVTSAETMLRLIHRPSSPTTVFGPTWEKSSRAEFDAELNRWKQLVASGR